MEGWKALEPSSLGGGTSQSILEKCKGSNKADCGASHGKWEENVSLIELVTVANLMVMVKISPHSSWMLLPDGWSLTVRFQTVLRTMKLSVVKICWIVSASDVLPSRWGISASTFGQCDSGRLSYPLLEYSMAIQHTKGFKGRLYFGDGGSTKSSWGGASFLLSCLWQVIRSRQHAGLPSTVGKNRGQRQRHSHSKPSFHHWVNLDLEATVLPMSCEPY